MALIERIAHGERLLALILRRTYECEGVHFLTPDNFSQQLAYMHHPPGHIIEPHRHNAVVRQVHNTQEVLMIRRGRLRVDFYSEAEAYLESAVLEAGDVILLADGGHGFEALEELEMIEVKQGPYTSGLDKTRFSSRPPKPFA